MTDDAMKELVTKHDKVIEQLVTSNAQIVTSVEHLVEAQKESNERQLATNERLEEISKYLAKQAVFNNKLETMDREIKESFTRRDLAKIESDKILHKRIDEIIYTQRSDAGCNSVKLLRKDVEVLLHTQQKENAASNSQANKLEALERQSIAMIKPTTLKWAIGIVILYSVTFGTYVVQSINTIEKINAEIISKLNRDIRDTDKLMTIIYRKGYNNGK